MKMPVLAVFLTDRAARLHEMSVEQIRVAISTDGVSQVMASAGQKISALGENEVEEGMVRLAASDAVSGESAIRAISSEDLAAQGIAEMIVGSELTEAAEAEAREGAAEVSAGSAVMGAAITMDEMAASLKEKSEKSKSK
jgi:hypothetical protein